MKEGSEQSYGGRREKAKVGNCMRVLIFVICDVIFCFHKGIIVQKKMILSD